MKGAGLHSRRRPSYGEGEQGGSKIQELHETLLRQAQGGDEQARAQLCQYVFAAAHKYARLVGLPSVYDADDFAQDVMIQLLEQLGTIQRLRGWLPAVLIGQRCTAFRRYFQLLSNASQDNDARFDAGSERLSEEEQSRQIDKLDFAILMRQLSEKQRIVITLHFVDDLPFSDISKATGIKPNTARMYLTRAKRLLQKHLNLHHGEGSSHGIDT